MPSGNENILMWFRCLMFATARPRFFLSIFVQTVTLSGSIDVFCRFAIAVPSEVPVLRAQLCSHRCVALQTTAYTVSAFQCSSSVCRLEGHLTKQSRAFASLTIVLLSSHADSVMVHSRAARITIAVHCTAVVLFCNLGFS